MIGCQGPAQWHYIPEASLHHGDEVVPLVCVMFQGLGSPLHTKFALVSDWRFTGLLLLLLLLQLVVVVDGGGNI